ncbi:MAG: division plane positioning ATPase MipZ [Rhodobacteraceae bacterium]|nr:division plane positioning ATPase MipZ [Paracoccaceae bacterium]
MATPAHVIVLGNEKGGSGKSTTAMHIFAALANAGAKIGALDLDTRQKSFFNYIENRRAFSSIRERHGEKPLRLPITRMVDASDHRDRDVAEQEELERFSAAIQDLYFSCDVIIIDCPGTDSYLSRLGHAAADTLITPMNDSFVDFDLLAKLDSESLEILGPSIYAEMVWECRKLRAEKGLELNWVVMRNRLPLTETDHMRFVGRKLHELSRRQGFRIVPGFRERSIYREMYLNGETLLDIDLSERTPDDRRSIDDAIVEIENMLQALKIPNVTDNGVF